MEFRFSAAKSSLENVDGPRSIQSSIHGSILESMHDLINSIREEVNTKKESCTSPVKGPSDITINLVVWSF